MKAIVIENKFRPMTNSFLPLGGRMMIKTDYSPVNSLRVVFLWAGSTSLSCFLFKTKRTWSIKRALRGSRKGCDGKGTQQRAYASVQIKHSFLWVNPQRAKLWRSHCTMKGHRCSQLRLSTGQRTAPQCWFKDLIENRAFKGLRLDVVLRVSSGWGIRRVLSTTLLLCLWDLSLYNDTVKCQRLDSNFSPYRNCEEYLFFS